MASRLATPPPAMAQAIPNMADTRRRETCGLQKQFWPGQADSVVEHYLGALESIKAWGIDLEISPKPTQLGLDFSFSDTQARLDRLVAAAAPATVWMDMEGSPYVDRTLELYKALRARHANVGICIQAYLRRTAEDIDSLLPLDPSIRLVKGAYLEPPSVAFPDKAEVDASFLRLTEVLLRARTQGGVGRAVIATHDPAMIEGTVSAAEGLGLSPGNYEFAMLFGIARKQQSELVNQGHALRVLISYGSAWFPWYMRRLAERPANLWFVMKQMVR